MDEKQIPFYHNAIKSKIMAIKILENMLLWRVKIWSFRGISLVSI